VFGAAEVPFRPHQCPNCNNYREEIKRCEGFSQTTPAGPMLAMFSGESQENCPRFEPAVKLDIEKLKENKDISGLINALHSKDSDVYPKAISAIKEIGEPAVEPLVAEMKKDKDSTFRYKAAIILGKIGDQKAVEPLFYTIQIDPVRDVRWHAVDSLGEIGSTEAIEALKQLLDDRDIFIQNAARDALSKIRKKQNCALADIKCPVRYSYPSKVLDQTFFSPYG